MSLVQYIILRKDLANNWSRGANIAQACHGVTKCLIEFKDDELVKQYTSRENIDQMTKIILEASDEEELSKLKIALNSEGIQFVEWLELPENTVTSIVLKPYIKDQVSKVLKRALRLYFERYGAVETVTLVCDSSNKSKGYGFVTFEDLNSVKEVLNKIHVIDLRQIDVKEPI